MEPYVYQQMFNAEETFWWHRGMREITTQLLASAVSRKDLKILDVGCGTGGMFGALRPYGTIYGIDQSAEAVRLAQSRGAEVAVGSIDSLPYPDDFFDLVVCSDVLYMQKPERVPRALSECVRVLRTGGTLFVREAAYNWLRSRHDRAVQTRQRFTKATLAALIRAQHLEIKKVSYVNFFLLPFIVVYRSIDRWLPMKEKDLFAPTKLDTLFFYALKLESRLLRYVHFPFGLSIVCVAQKPTKNENRE